MNAATSNSTDTASAAPPQAASQFYQADNYSAHDSIGNLMRQIMLALGQDIERQMVPLGLTNAQWKPLVMLHLGHASTVAELARHCNLDTSAMTRLLDRLEAKGYCVRNRSSVDRRVVQLELTDAGRTAAQAIPAVLCGVQNAYLQGFSQAEWETLKAMMQRLLANAQLVAERCPLAAPLSEPITP